MCFSEMSLIVSFQTLRIFKLCAVACATLFFLLPISVHSEQIATLSRKQMSEELALTYKLLRTYQPNVYLYRSRKQLNKIYAEIKSDIGDTNDLVNAYTLIARMMGAICDQHTYIDPRSSGAAVVGLKYVWVPDKQKFDFRNGELFAELRVGLGSHKLVEVDGIPSEKLSTILAQTMPKDGCLSHATQSIMMLAPHALLPFSSLTGDEDRYKATYFLSDLNEVWPTRAVRERLPQVLRDARNSNHSINEQRENVLREFGYEPYDFPENEENSRFRNARNPGDIEFRYSDISNSGYLRLGELPDFDQTELYIHQIFKSIIQLNPSSLVLDLTQSPGGNIKTASLITAYLMHKSHRLASHIKVRTLSTIWPKNFRLEEKNYVQKRKRLFRHLKKVGRRNGVYKTSLSRISFGLPHYKGRLFILVGPDTASAATLVAKYLQRERSAIVMGTASLASARNFCSLAPGNFELPFSKFDLKIPHICFENDKTPSKNNGRIIPDVEIDGYPSGLVYRTIAIYREGLKEVTLQGLATDNSNR